MAAVPWRLEGTTEVEYWLVPLCVGSQTIRLSTFPVEIGRGFDADVELGDIHVSRRHCEIVRTEETLAVHDLGSKNGTFVNGVRTAFSPLGRGDLLRVGGMQFVVRAAVLYRIDCPTSAAIQEDRPIVPGEDHPGEAEC
jgi:pSer/pThr/pTyr-binding forkhead associated (FHA) protein